MSSPGHPPLLMPGESIAQIEPNPHGSQGWAYGYNYGEIQNSTHEAGNSVLLEVEPLGAVEPVLITGNITLSVQTLQGKGYAVVYNIETQENVRIVGLNPTAEPLQLGRGDAYYYLNDGYDHLILRDDCTPAFQGDEEVQLTTRPVEEGALDGRAVELPNAFWRYFNLTRPNPFPYLEHETYNVAPGQYKVFDASTEPIQIRRGEIFIITEGPQGHPDPLPGVHSRGFYTGPNRGKTIVSFLYHKRGEDGELETSERAIILEGIGYGEHPGHKGQPPTWYLVGYQIGTIDHETGAIISMPEADVEIPVKHFSLACITDGPLGEAILANPNK